MSQNVTVPGGLGEVFPLAVHRYVLGRQSKGVVAVKNDFTTAASVIMGHVMTDAVGLAITRSRCWYELVVIVTITTQCQYKSWTRLLTPKMAS